MKPSAKKNGTTPAQSALPPVSDWNPTQEMENLQQ
jgi:hypothetical protein